MSRTPAGPPGNLLLGRLPRDEYRRVLAHLEPVSLAFRDVLYEARAPVDYAYFPVRSVISAIIRTERGNAIEAAAIGSEGVVGFPVFLGPVTSSHQVIVQIAGTALRIKGRDLEEVARGDGPVRRLLLCYQCAYVAQLAQGVACNGLHSVHQRCCRWLLMTQDRVRADVLPLTHEFLSVLLGVRRASISTVLEPLQEAGLVRSQRGRVTVLNRGGLEAASCECYQVLNNEFTRLLGRPPGPQAASRPGSAGAN